MPCLYLLLAYSNSGLPASSFLTGIIMQLTVEEKYKLVRDYLKYQGVGARFFPSVTKTPATFMIQIQTGVDIFKRQLPAHTYDPSGFYLVEVEPAYHHLERAINRKKALGLL